MVDWLTEPWQYEFMQRALWAGVLVSLAGAVVGAFVVVKGLAFMSDAVAHSSLAGAAVAFVAGGTSVAISLGAVVAAVLTAVGVSVITRTSRLRKTRPLGCSSPGSSASQYSSFRAPAATRWTSTRSSWATSSA